MENIGNGGPLCYSKWKIIGEHKKKDAIESSDYINSLPDEAMFHIFSLLPFEVLVIASLVSYKWESLVKSYLYNLESSLRFDELEMAIGHVCTNNDFLLCSLHDFPFMHRVHFQTSAILGFNYFHQFLDRVLHLLRGCFLKKVSLALCYDGLRDNQKKVDKWFQFVMTNEVKELELNFSKGMLIGWGDPRNSYLFPDLRCASKSLERVELHFCNLLMFHIAGFCSIQSLVLKDVNVFGFSIRDLVRKCPRLMDLTLERCYIPKYFMVSRKDIMIKSLKLINCSTPTRSSYPIRISVPELLTFTLEVSHLTRRITIKAPNLLDVVIAVNSPRTSQQNQQALVKLLGQSSHCRTLTLNTWSIQVLSYGALLMPQLPIPFNNLKHLKLGVGLENEELLGIAYKLKNCPILESLTIYIYKIAKIRMGGLNGQIGDNFNFDNDQYWPLQVLSFRCLQRCLKKVTFFGISGKTTEERLLRFLLENARVLEEMSIYSPDENLSIEIGQQLATYRKASFRARIYMFCSG